MPHRDLSKEALLIELSRIDGIDPVKALKAMSGQTELYLKLVKGFAQEHSTRAVEIKTLTQDNDICTLERHCHSLKSYCAYIGAYDLSTRCAQAEAQLNKGEMSPELLYSIADDIKYFVKRLSQILEQTPKITGVNIKPFDLYQFKKALIALLPLLKKSDFAAEEALTQLQAIAQDSPYSEDISQLCALVDDVEYEVATEQVITLLEKLI